MEKHGARKRQYLLEHFLYFIYNNRRRFFMENAMCPAEEITLSDRIVVNADICHGKPIIRGTRIMVWLVLEYLANGDSVADILTAYPSLTELDIQACLAYASRAAQERVVPVEISTNAF